MAQRQKKGVERGTLKPSKAVSQAKPSQQCRPELMSFKAESVFATRSPSGTTFSAGSPRGGDLDGEKSLQGGRCCRVLSKHK
jgi:hypothetical protein